MIAFRYDGDDDLVRCPDRGEYIAEHEDADPEGALDGAPTEMVRTVPFRGRIIQGMVGGREFEARLYLHGRDRLSPNHERDVAVAVERLMREGVLA